VTTSQQSEDMEGGIMRNDAKLKGLVRLSVCTLVLCLGFAWNANAGAEHEFVGAKKCSLCHKKPEQGEQYPIWEKGPHAKAYEVLGSDKAKEVGAALGIDDPQSSPKCLKCHSTAYYFTEARVTDKIEVSEAISCESCHGPGKDYMKKDVMKDREKAIAAGLQTPNEETCRRCHNPDSPGFESFDFIQRWEKIKHPIPKK
jgi:hypothetical protein